MDSAQPVGGLILAGGRATRMGGVDKGLVPLAGKPMINHVLERLAPQLDQVLINANRHLPQYRELGYTVLADSLDDYQGPLAGMLAGLQHCQTKLMITAPCDSPLPPLDYVSRMLGALNQADAELAVATDGKRLQPVFCLLSTRLGDSLQAFLAAGDRKIDLWFAQHKMVEVDFSDQPQAFANINTAEQRDQLEQLLLADKDS
ncbi:MAG: molybdenum cofactor guanylyltransferase MobA [Granulosicoccaceae bacterium]